MDRDLIFDCWSLSGDGVDWLCIGISSTLVICDGCVSIFIVLVRRCFLRGLRGSAVVSIGCCVVVIVGIHASGILILLPVLLG